MRPVKGYNNAQASTDFERLAAGGYVIKITDIKNDEAKEYLRVVYDIAEGPEKGRYATETAENDYRHNFIRSYKEKALGMFKAFIRAIDESNGTKFDSQVETGIREADLIGKVLGAVFGYEEYEANDGNVKERLRLANCMSADRVRKGDFKVPELKKLKTSSASTNSVPTGFTPLSDEDVPI